MNRFFGMLGLVLSMMVPAAQGQTTKAQTKALININLPTNTTKSITAKSLREVLNLMTDYTSGGDSVLRDTLASYVSKAGADTITGHKTIVSDMKVVGDLSVVTPGATPYTNYVRGYGLQFENIQYPYISVERPSSGFFIQTYDWDYNPYQAFSIYGKRVLVNPHLNVGDVNDSTNALAVKGNTVLDGQLTVTGRIINNSLENSFARKDTLANFVRLAGSYANPAWITSLDKGKVGLGNVDNTTDLSKPISTATQAALDAKANMSALSNYVDIPSAQVITGAKTFGSVISSTVNSGTTLQIGTTGTNGSFRHVINGSTSWFGIYDTGNNIHYGFASGLGTPITGVSAVGGWYSGIGVMGAVSMGNTNPVFGVKANDTGALHGVSGNLFNVYGNKKITTFNSVLDDGTGGMVLGSGVSAGFKFDVNGTSRFSNPVTVNSTLDNPNLILINTSITGENRGYIGIRSSDNALYLRSLAGGGVKFLNGGGTAEIFKVDNLGVLTTTGDAYINGVRVGSGAINTITILGREAGLNNTGPNNTFLGNIAGRSLTTGNNSVFVGSNAGLSTTTPNSNTMVGTFSGMANTTGHTNVYLGTNSAVNNTIGAANIVIGGNSGRWLSDGTTNATIFSNSILIGTDVRLAGDNQSNQIVIGHNAIGLGSNTTVLGNSSTTFTRLFGNVGIGTTTNAGFALDVNGTARIQGIGLINGVTVASNATNTTILGAGSVNSGNTGISNIFIGGSAGIANTTGASNTFVGVLAGSSNTTGGTNTAVGAGALTLNTTGQYNSALGWYANANLNGGNNNASFGFEAGRLQTSSSNNTAIGMGALRENTSGSSNVALGMGAGRYITGLASNTISTTSIYIGVNAKAAADNQANQIVIGHDATGLGSNTTVLGNGSTTFTRLYGNVGIGTNSNVGHGLDVAGTARVTGRATVQTLSLTDVPVYADNAAALAGGLTAGMVYRTSTGVLMITY